MRRRCSPPFCKRRETERERERERGGRGDSGSLPFTRKWLLKNMALLMRVLVSAGIIFCGRMPGLGVGIGEGGAGGVEESARREPVR
jgi:hypothetical protein